MNLIQLKKMDIGEVFSFPNSDKVYEVSLFFTSQFQHIICVYYDEETSKFYCCNANVTVEPM